MHGSGEHRGWCRPVVSRPFWAGRLAACLLAVVGCGAEEVKSPVETAAAPTQYGLHNAESATAKTAAREVPRSEAPGEAAVPPAVPRKIVYNARVTVVVESVPALDERIAELVKQAGGYVADSDQSSDTHAQRNATWTVRLPVEQFDRFLKTINRLGEVQQAHVESQDVTQEFYDVEARIANKQQEEKRLLKHLSESTGKLEDILTVEREVSRVRGEIEAMQGRIRYLANVSALSTVTIVATEVRDFKPPVRATFATQVSRTFARSLENLKEFVQAIVLVVVAIAPWLPILAVVALPIVVALRRANRRGLQGPARPGREPG